MNRSGGKENDHGIRGLLQFPLEVADFLAIGLVNLVLAWLYNVVRLAIMGGVCVFFLPYTMFVTQNHRVIEPVVRARPHLLRCTMLHDGCGIAQRLATGKSVPKGTYARLHVKGSRFSPKGKKYQFC